VSGDHAVWAQKADEAEALLRFFLRAYGGRVALSAFARLNEPASPRDGRLTKRSSAS
jgi:hypothetical protein